MNKKWVAVVLTVLAGSIGSLASVFALGKGTYEMAPFKVRLAIKPAVAGSTTIAVEPLAGLTPGRATAGTHRGPLKFDATITGVSADGLANSKVSCLTSGTQNDETCKLDPADPQSIARFMAENSSSAAKKFGLKVAVLTLAGGLMGGLIVSMGSWKRMVGGMLAGTLVVGGLGVLAKLTYDTSKFAGTTFSSSSSASP